jgi:transcriptional regulator with XRE-family HTH domain
MELRRGIGQAIRQLREDAGLTLTHVALAAGVDRRYLARVESGDRGASVETLAVVLAVLGADLSLKAYPTTGPTIRDRHQAPMVEALLRALHPRWRASPEVPVYRPARGVIDVVLDDTVSPLAVASEHHSELRRLEQQVRWHREKELSLPSAELWRFLQRGEVPPPTSRLLVLRSTRATRALANAHEQTLEAAYPARTRAILAALTTADAPWPGSGIMWMNVEGGRAELLDGPPRGVQLGR